MTRFNSILILLLFFSTLLFFSCTQQDTAEESALTWETVQDSDDILVSIDGFSGPEAVRYDPDQDIYFISNFNGPGGERDSNGFVSKVSPQGLIDSLRFMTGTEEHPLHAPRGMYITGDTLWAADADGVHGFDRISGSQIAFIDFTTFEPGFLNDIVMGSEGALYVTDTGKSVVYKIEKGAPSEVTGTMPYPPNGITINSKGDVVIAPWNGGLTFYQITTATPGYIEFMNAESGGNYDGIEFIEGRMLAASQVDSSLHVLHDNEDQIAIKTPGRPADIGIDTKRNRVAVPYVALNRVDIWQLPGEM